MNNEIWKDIEGYEGLYQVSNYGNVKSLNYNHTHQEHNLKPRKVKNYLQVLLSKNKIAKQYYIHRLVAEAFLDKSNFKFMPDEDISEININSLEVNHKDENPLNCCSSNLEWCSKLYNVNYGTSKERLKLINSGKKLSVEHKIKISQSNLKRRRFNKQLNDFLIDNAQNYTVKELVLMVNNQFNENFTKETLSKYLYRNKIKFKYENKNRSHKMGTNYPIGYEYKRDDGMILVKVNKNSYEYKQRLIYEQYYGVKLTSDDFIIFLDQDRTNFDIKNLKKVSRRESSVLANQKIFSKDPNTTKLGISIAKTIIKAKDCEALYANRN